MEIEPPDDRDEFEVMRKGIEDIERIRRYERRAWSRRNRAIGNLASVGEFVVGYDLAYLNWRHVNNFSASLPHWVTFLRRGEMATI